MKDRRRRQIEYNESTFQKEIQMAKTKSSNISVSQEGGVVRNILNQLKLIFRLMKDRRVSFLAKLVPIGAFAYLLMPADIVPNVVLPGIGMLDDAAVLWLGTYIFTELCPPAVVAEHMKELTGNMDSKDIHDDVVDAEATDVKE
jgi:uncharacterized membrane protein YkvA (DUF1232 family)